MSAEQILPSLRVRLQSFSNDQLNKVHSNAISREFAAQNWHKGLTPTEAQMYGDIKRMALDELRRRQLTPEAYDKALTECMHSGMDSHERHQAEGKP